MKKTKDGIFLCKGKGTDTPIDYDETEHWNDWEEMKSEKMLFKRIKELLTK